MAIDPNGVASNSAEGMRLLLEQQMRDFLSAEGFPDAEGWTPRWKIVKEDGGYRVGFIDERSVGWYNHRMGTDLEVIQYRDPGRGKTPLSGMADPGVEPRLNRAQRRAAMKKMKRSKR
jgi:hypothetical protein